MQVMGIRIISRCPTRVTRLLRLFGTTHQDVNIEKYDIVISGGGMVGFAMASALGQSSKLCDRKILLLEGTPKKHWSLPDDYSNRVCALNESTRQQFENLGIWTEISNMRVQAIKRMQVWEACSEAMITFDPPDSGEDALAYVVENDVILEAIKRLVPESVHIEYSTKVQGYKLPATCSEGVLISLPGERTIQTDLLIAADGAKSLVRELMGTKHLSFNYDQMGIVATLELSEPCENTIAWQRFLPTGPIAFLPLSDTSSSLVWSTSKENARVMLSMSDEDFTHALNNAMWHDNKRDEVVQKFHEGWMNILETLSPWGGGAEGIRQLPPSIKSIKPQSRAAFPLGLGHAVHYVAPGVALIGDAAHRVHPLAGQGVNLGFGDVATLLQTLEEAVMLGSHIGNEQELYKYESARQKHNVATVAFIDGLYRLYSSTATPIVLLRALGLSTVNALVPLKKRIVAHAEY